MQENRRPIASRSTKWANLVASYLAKKSITPNQISTLSMIFALFGAFSLVFLQEWGGFILCIFCIQLRLLCNLFDGMVALEGGKKSISGAIYNEFPDRVADTLFLLGAGYAANLAELGYIASLLAMATAYIRVFASSVGISQSFVGPMAKQHRMAVLTLSLLVAQFEWLYFKSYYALHLALYIIIIGAIITCYNRTKYILDALKKEQNANI